MLGLSHHPQLSHGEVSDLAALRCDPSLDLFDRSLMAKHCDSPGHLGGNADLL
jgi:hypothetical protein